jgi:hypothetical protein
MTYASSLLMLAIGRRIFDIPLEERLQARTSDLGVLTKTMLPIIRLSISEAQNQIRTGHQDFRTYFSGMAEPERNMSYESENVAPSMESAGMVGVSTGVEWESHEGP